MSHFRTTLWTRVIDLAAQGEAGDLLSERERDAAEQARNRLCELYWYPVYVYLRGRGRSHEHAQDLTQECFLKLFQGERLSHADRRRGKFRTFLLNHVDGLMSDDYKRQKAGKRGGGSEHLPLDFAEAAERYENQFADAADPARAYDLAWAQQVLDRTMALLERDYATRHPDVPFAALRGHLPGGGGTRRPYAEIAGQHPGVTENVLMVRVSRLRDRFPEVLRSVLSESTTDPLLAEEEYQHLVRLVLEG